jgi:hypothetical protein
VLLHEYRCPRHGVVRADDANVWADPRLRCPRADHAGHACHQKLLITRVQTNVVRIEDYRRRRTGAGGSSSRTS